MKYCSSSEDTEHTRAPRSENCATWDDGSEMYLRLLMLYSWLWEGADEDESGLLGEGGWLRSPSLACSAGGARTQPAATPYVLLKQPASLDPLPHSPFPKPLLTIRR